MMKFLVVDDEKDVEMLFLQKFRKEIRSGAIEMVFAFSGDEALSILNDTKPPDVVYVFSDINMPGMSGLELLKKIKNDYPEIKVSMISLMATTTITPGQLNRAPKNFSPNLLISTL
jgi:two-component system, response regulator, stage 0 sporulation protein F